MPAHKKKWLTLLNPRVEGLMRRPGEVTALRARLQEIGLRHSLPPGLGEQIVREHKRIKNGEASPEEALSAIMSRREELPKNLLEDIQTLFKGAGREAKP